MKRTQLFNKDILRYLKVNVAKIYGPVNANYYVQLMNGQQDY